MNALVERDEPAFQATVAPVRRNQATYGAAQRISVRESVVDRLQPLLAGVADDRDPHQQRAVASEAVPSAAVHLCALTTMLSGTVC